MRVKLTIAAVVLSAPIAGLLFLRNPPPAPDSSTNSPTSSRPAEIQQTPVVPNPSSKTTLIEPRRPAATAPSVAALRDALIRESDGAWQVSVSDEGVVSSLTGARLSLEGEGGRDWAENFLSRFAPLLGLSAEQARLQAVRSMGTNTQVIYGQAIANLPVFGARVNLIFDAEGNIIYLNSSVYSGAVSTSNPISAAMASAKAAVALRAFRERAHDEGLEILPPDLERVAELGYRLVGGEASMVYRFLIRLNDSPLADMEIFVDAVSGAAISVRSLSRR